MKISELPPEIRALAEKNRAADTVLPGNRHDNIINAFQFSHTPEGFDFWQKWHVARTEQDARSSLATIPSPETLRPLLEAALAIMEPNDPAREDLKVDVTLTANGRGFFSVYFFFYGDGKSRDCHANGKTTEEALEAFKGKYTPPHTVGHRIAELRAELANLEGGQ